MKMKKVIALTLASVMTLLATACGAKEPEKGAAAETTKAAAEKTEEKAEETKTAETVKAAEAEGDIKEVVFPEQVNNGEPCTIRFGWWGGQTRHERTEEVVKMFMEKYPNVTIQTEPADFGGYFQKLPTLVGAHDVCISAWKRLGRIQFYHYRFNAIH